MAECDVCGERVSMPYQCRHCGGTFCAEHRLPEAHDCPGLKQWEQSGPVFDSGFDTTVGNTKTEKGLAAKLGIDTGPGGPLAYFRGNMTYVFLGLMWVTFLLQTVVLAVVPGLHDSLFVFSPENPFYVWTWVTSIFAHGGVLHIVFNSIVIYFFGRLVEQYLGWQKFAALFIVSGILAGGGQVLSNMLIDVPIGVVGASGAALALLGVLTVLNPNLTVYLYFVLPLPIWVLSGGTVAISLFLIVGGDPGAGGIAHMAHLVGILVGLAYGKHISGSVRIPSQMQFGGGGPGGGMPPGPGGPGGPGRRRF